MSYTEYNRLSPGGPGLDEDLRANIQDRWVSMQTEKKSAQNVLIDQTRRLSVPCPALTLQFCEQITLD